MYGLTRLGCVTWLCYWCSGSRGVLTQAAYIAEYNRGCVLELTCFDVPDNSLFSFFPNEAECLLPPNSRFIALADSKTKSLVAGNGEVFLLKIICLQQVESEGAVLIS